MDKSNLEKIKYGIFADLKQYKKEKLRFLLAFILVVLSYGYSRSDASNSNDSEVTSLSLDNYSPTIESVETLIRSSDLDSFYGDNLESNSILVSQINSSVEDANNDIRQEKIYNFLVQSQIDYEQLDQVLSLMRDYYGPYQLGIKTEEEALEFILSSDEIPTEVKAIVIMVRDNSSYSELDTSVAGCVSEAAGAGECYDDAYGVASVLLNRITDVPYVNTYGDSIYGQFTAHTDDERYQFSVYKSKAYLAYMGRTDLVGYQAAIDAFYSREPMHDWLEFRASWVDMDVEYEQFVENGNKYRTHRKETNIIPYPEFTLLKEDCVYNGDIRVTTNNYTRERTLGK